MKQIPQISLALTRQSLAEKVQRCVDREHVRYSEAVVMICDELGILDSTDVAHLIKGTPLEEKIKIESIRLNTLRGQAKNETMALS